MDVMLQNFTNSVSKADSRDMKSTRSKESAIEAKQGATSTRTSPEMKDNQINCETVSEVVSNVASSTPDSVAQSLNDRVSETTPHTAFRSKCPEPLPRRQEDGTESKIGTNSNGHIGDQNPANSTTKQMPSDAKGKGNIKSKKKSHRPDANSKPKRNQKGKTKSPKKQLSSRSKSTSGSDNEGSSFKKKNAPEKSKNPIENHSAKSQVLDETTQQKDLKLFPLASMPKVKKHAATEPRPPSLPKTKFKKSPQMKQNTAKGKTSSWRKKKIKSPRRNQRNMVPFSPDDAPSPPKRIKLEPFDALDSITTNLSQPAKHKTSKSQVDETSDEEEENKKSKKYVRIYKEIGRRARARKRSKSSSASRKRKASVQRRKKARTKRKKSPKRRKARSPGKGKSKSRTARLGKGKK